MPTGYQVVNGYDPRTHRQSIDTLSARVAGLMREGWAPLGGIAAYVSDGVPSFLQAMVRYG